MFLKAFCSSNIFQIHSHVQLIYYEPYYIYIKLYFQHQIKLPLLNVKIYVRITLAMTPILHPTL
jgi:hypothetical protein